MSPGGLEAEILKYYVHDDSRIKISFLDFLLLGGDVLKSLNFCYSDLDLRILNEEGRTMAVPPGSKHVT